MNCFQITFVLHSTKLLHEFCLQALVLGELFHGKSCLFKLLDEAVYLCHRGAGALGNTLAAAGPDNQVV